MLRRYLYRATGSVTSGATATVTTIQLPIEAQKPVWILGFHLVQTAGTASNWIPSVGQTSGYTIGDISTRVQYASAAVSTPINDVFTEPIPCMTDADGRLYLKIGWVGVSTNNEASFEFWFEYPGGS